VIFPSRRPRMSSLPRPIINLHHICMLSGFCYFILVLSAVASYTVAGNYSHIVCSFNHTLTYIYFGEISFRYDTYSSIIPYLSYRNDTGLHPGRPLCDATALLWHMKLTFHGSSFLVASSCPRDILARTWARR